MIAVMRRPFIALLLACAGTALAAGPDTAALLAERQAAYREFRAAFDTGRYSDALPHAERVVVLTEQLAGDPAELPRALDNAGATQYRLGDFVAAEASYGRALQLLEERHGAASRQLLTPLRGLALTYQAAGRRDAAVPLLERAVAISRRSDGLFNDQQIELLEPLIEGYVATGRWQDAEQAQLYAYQLNERKYRGDPKLNPALKRLALWYEQTRRFASARRTWSRMYVISTDEAHPNLVGAVDALRGMARTHRLEYLYGPEVVNEAEAQNADSLGFRMDSAERDPFGRRIQSGTAISYQLDPQGREYLQAALALVERADPPQPYARGILLVELGDWQMLARGGDARQLYARAWPLLPHEPGAAEGALRNPLLYPGQLLYRAPAAARRYADLPEAAVIVHYAVAEFTVAADGRVQDAKVVEGDADDDQKASFLNALNRAVYRPRYVDGSATETEKVRFRETFRERRPDPAPAG
jgi:tetratricopeptide (TPR) repeat protein